MRNEKVKRKNLRSYLLVQSLVNIHINNDIIFTLRPDVGYFRESSDVHYGSDTLSLLLVSRSLPLRLLH